MDAHVFNQKKVLISNIPHLKTKQNDSHLIQHSSEQNIAQGQLKAK